jgi:hypothetical protein
MIDQHRETLGKPVEPTWASGEPRRANRKQDSSIRSG